MRWRIDSAQNAENELLVVQVVQKSKNATPKELPGESSSLECDGSSDREIGGATPGPSGSTHELFVSPEHELSLVNQTIVVIGESLIIKRKASTSVHCVEKIN